MKTGDDFVHHCQLDSRFMGFLKILHFELHVSEVTSLFKLPVKS
jgi:hypothetical protein